MYILHNPLFHNIPSKHVSATKGCCISSQNPAPLIDEVVDAGEIVSHLFLQWSSRVCAANRSA